MRVLLVILLSMSLLACKANPFKEDMPEGLYNASRTFEDVVRWGKLEKMVMFLKPDAKNPPKPQAGLDNIRVTSYESAAPLSKASETRWTQSAIVDYVLIDRQIVRQLTDHQIWVTEDEGKTWYRENPVPVFR